MTPPVEFWIFYFAYWAVALVALWWALREMSRKPGGLTRAMGRLFDSIALALGELWHRVIDVAWRLTKRTRRNKKVKR